MRVRMFACARSCVCRADPDSVILRFCCESQLCERKNELNKCASYQSCLNVHMYSQYYELVNTEDI